MINKLYTLIIASFLLSLGSNFAAQAPWKFDEGDAVYERGSVRIERYDSIKSAGLDGLLVNNSSNSFFSDVGIYLGPFRYQIIVIGTTDGGIATIGNTRDGHHYSEISQRGVDYITGTFVNNWGWSIGNAAHSYNSRFIVGASTNSVVNRQKAVTGNVDYASYEFTRNGQLNMYGVAPAITLYDSNIATDSQKIRLGHADNNGSFALSFRSGVDASFVPFFAQRGESTNSLQVRIRSNQIRLEGPVTVDSISGPGAGLTSLTETDVWILDVSRDEMTELTTGIGKYSFYAPYVATITGVRASVTTAPTGSILIVDIHESGATILSTKLTIDSDERTSVTAAATAVISDAAVADNTEYTINIDQVGSIAAGSGLKVYIEHTH